MSYTVMVFDAFSVPIVVYTLIFAEPAFSADITPFFSEKTPLLPLMRTTQFVTSHADVEPTGSLSPPMTQFAASAFGATAVEPVVVAARSSTAFPTALVPFATPMALPVATLFKMSLLLESTSTFQRFAFAVPVEPSARSLV